MACSSSTSPEPGSRPSSWPSARRAVRIEARASPLPPAAVLRQGEQLPAPLPPRLLPREHDCSRDDVVVQARVEPGLEQVLLGVAPQLLETGRLQPSRHPVQELGHRLAPPQRERPLERGRCALG